MTIETATNSNNIHRFKVPESLAGLRADVAVSELLADFSRAQVTRFMKECRILVEGKKVKPSKIFEGGETITFEPPKTISDKQIAPEDIPLNVIYEDEDLIVLDKPAGMVVHPGSGVQTGTLVNALVFHYPELFNVDETGRPGIVHRLDKETSGVMVVARNNESRMFLIDQFKQRKVKKEYLAIICGVPEKESGVFTSGIGRHTVKRIKMSSKTNSAKEAQTIWSAEKKFKDYTLVKATPMTGRTHQIRVHFSEAGYPLLSDRIYGNKRSSRPVGGYEPGRHALHAHALSFVHPGTKKEVQFNVALPDDMKKVLDILEVEHS